MYRLDRMRKDYEKFTKADKYFIGFPFEDDVYYIDFKKIPRRYTKVQKECSSAGGGYGLYVCLRSLKARTALLKKAVKVCKVADLEDEKYNKGVMFEKAIYERFGQTFRGKDNVPFHKGGDIVINGEEVQIKYMHARICYDKTLTKLKKSEI